MAERSPAAAAAARVHRATTDPPPTKQGGHTLTPSPAPSGLGSRFDWYEATIDGVDDGRVHLGLALAFGAEVRRSTPRNRYAEAWDVVLREDVLATVYGRSARDGEVHVAMTGSASLAGVPALRRSWPQHRVSRVDSAVDFAAEFDALDSLALSFAEDRGLKHSIIRNSEGGATRRIGSPASEVFVRIYKKSEQWRALHPDRADEIADGIVRAECVVRPGKRATKEAVSVLGSDDCCGVGEWSKEFASLVLGFDAVRSPTHTRRPSDWSRSLHYQGVQYGPGVARRVAEVGLEQARAEVLATLGLS